MIVYCQSEYCRWNAGYQCNRGAISLDLDNECEDFESYLDDEEWKSPYWKRMIDHETKQVFRVLYHGKKIEMDGVNFFVGSNSDYAIATEETTGLSCGQICDIESRIGTIIEKMPGFNLRLLEELPVGVYDEKTRRVKPIKDAEPNEKGGADHDR